MARGLADCNRDESESGLSYLLYLARADAGGAHAQTPAGAVDQRPDILQIQIPATLRHVMGMADPVAELGASAADFANLCHNFQLYQTVYFLANVAPLWQEVCI